MADERGDYGDSLKSLRRELRTQRHEMLTLVNERDRRYTDRSAQQDKAVVDALAAAEKAVNAALVAADKAVVKEEVNAEKWRDNANEWRQAMNDRETRFLGKDEANLMVSGVTARVDALEKHSDKESGRSQGLSAAWGYLVGAIATAALIASVLVALLK